jgi:dihydrofolate reductase
MKVSLVAALDRNRAIGRGNELPWRLPDDLRRFKALTLGKPVLMGRKTAESLGRALPGRPNLVLTRGGRVPFEGMHAVASMEEALAAAAAAAQGADELCVIGGGEVYALALPRADVLHLTHVDTVVTDADAFFPAWEPAQWRVAMREQHAADAKHAHAFEFADYLRPSAPKHPRAGLTPCAGAAAAPTRRGPAPAARAVPRCPAAAR